MRLVHLSMFMMLAWSSAGWTADAPQASGAASWGDTQKALLFEGLFAFNSACAAANPRITGGAMLITAPLAFAEGMHGPLDEDIVGVTGYGAIGLYDTVGYPARFSRQRVFVENLAAWNVWGGVMLLVDHGNADGTGAKFARHVSVMPQPHGGVRVAYRWTF